MSDLRPIGLIRGADSCGNPFRITVIANPHGLLTITAGFEAPSNHLRTHELPISVAEAGGTNTAVIEAIKAALKYPKSVKHIYVEPEPRAN